MASEKEPRVVPVEASDATACAGITKGPGKGLSWNDVENLALVKAASIVCSNPAVGSGMTAAEMNRKIRSEFIQNPMKPKEACTSNDKGPFDSRRWDGRSAVACGRQWETLRRECTRFKGCHDRIKNMKVTGNPTEEDLFRCASLIYSDGGKSISHVYDCVRNPHYHISKPFKLDKPYHFLSTETKILDASSARVEVDEKVERPMGTKAAKKQKDQKKLSGASLDDNSVSSSIKRIENMLASNAERRHHLYQEKLSFQREKMEWETAKVLMGPGSNANSEEREQMNSLLRKRLMNSLLEGINHTSEKRLRQEDNEEEKKIRKNSGSDGVSALLKISNVSGPHSVHDASSTFNAAEGDLS